MAKPRGASDPISALEERIGHQFQSRDLIERALTHGSWGDGRRKVRDNQRLEFLGDRVLGLIAARKVFESYTDDEGGLAVRYNALVRKEACARAAERAGIGDAMRMSRSTETGGGRESVSILGDACEAVIAALYLDAGYEAAEVFFERFWAEELPAADGARGKSSDPKTRLQEWAHAQFGANPQYRSIERSGPDHRPVFVVEVTVGDLPPERGEGGSKRTAERSAAKALLAREHANE